MDLRNGVRVCISNLFDEISPECGWNSARVVGYGAVFQHGNEKAVFHDYVTNGIGTKCEDSFDCSQLIFL